MTGIYKLNFYLNFVMVTGNMSFIQSSKGLGSKHSCYSKRLFLFPKSSFNKAKFKE